MNLRITIIIIILINSFKFNYSVAQIQFQKRYGNNYYVQKVNGLQESNNGTSVLYSFGRCIVGNAARQLIPALLNFDTLGVPLTSYIYGTSNCDTIYNFVDFQVLRNDYFLVGSVVKDTMAKAAISLINDSLLTSWGFYISQNGISAFDRVNLDSSKNNIYISGYIDTNGVNNVDNGSLLLKCDKALNVSWAKMFTSNYDLRIIDFKVKDDGSIIVCGNIVDFNNISMMVVFKMDTSANILWAKSYKPSGYSTANSLVFNGSSIVICGNTIDTTTNSNSSYLMQLDSNGAVQWCQHYIYSFAGNQNNLVKTLDNGYLISNVTTFNNITGMCQMKLDSIGSIQWDNMYDKTSWNVKYFNVVKQNGDIISLAPTLILGSGGAPDKTNIYLIKSANYGVSGCYEAVFPLQASSYNNFVSSNININSYDISINRNYFQFTRDTISLVEDIFCSTNSITVPEVSSIKSFIISNPLINLVTLKFYSVVKEFSDLLITNMDGKVVSKLIIDSNFGWNEVNYNTSSLSSGMYFLVYSLNGKQVSLKFIKI